MPSSKQAVTLVLPLLIMLIFSSSISVAFARDVFYSKPVCRVTSQTQIQTNQTCYYTQTTTYNKGKSVTQDYCYDSFRTTTIKDFVCGTRYLARTSIGSTSPLPPSAAAALPPSTPPSTVLPPPSTLPLPSKRQTITTTRPDSGGWRLELMFMMMVIYP
jgi:hypothetical protein